MIIVTGGAGFIGSALIWKLNETMFQISSWWIGWARALNGKIS